jgi:glutathione S-transferase
MLPRLYTFRRCPYAIRARLAIKISNVEVEMCEVSLRDKPQAMLDCSPKGTVPVLQLANGAVLDESLDIMRWALAIHDPQSWLNESALSQDLIAQNDSSFKQNLDRYKYADRYPEHSVEYHREQAEIFLRLLNERLGKHKYLMGERPDFTDMAILPFVRQCAHVDKEWFYASRYTHLIRWLDGLLLSDLFISVMKK